MPHIRSEAKEWAAENDRGFPVWGELNVGNDAYGNGGEPFAGATYAVRPPGVAHGPFESNGGCMLLELHYYGPA
ncbi:MAG TPA: hypothetical protein VHD15_17635 [Hyphomicrobiales bacterium]|nr:hypothetical protein [Hyphomicrobiales bacterium]